MAGIEIAKKSDLDKKADENHNHDGKYQPVGDYADKNHTHSYKDLTDKPTIPSVDGLAKQSDLDVLTGRISALEAKIAELQPPEE